jgi:hypothetical protein
MNCTIPVLEINKEDCIGDSLGKHNFNALALDTIVCNLSTQFYNKPEINFEKIKNEITDLIAYYGSMQYYIKDVFKNDMSYVSSTVNLLSSFWNNYEFSILIPINAISMNDNDLAILAPVLPSVSPASLDAIANTTLKTLADIELSTNYNAISYPNNTIINVGFFLYNLVPVISDTNGNDPLTKVTYSPSPTFNFTQRSIDATYTRDSIHLTTGVILRYYVSDQKWNYIGYILDDGKSTASPNENVQAIKPPPVNPNEIKTVDNNYITKCNPINAGVWYSADQYIYASGLYTGTSGKLGTITLTFRTAKNQTSIFSYTAGGYNATTNSGGTDVYLEFNGSVINAYEQYPTPKTLVKTWPYPYTSGNIGETGVNFKFTSNNNGVRFTVCGSTGLV